MLRVVPSPAHDRGRVAAEHTLREVSRGSPPGRHGPAERRPQPETAGGVRGSEHRVFQPTIVPGLLQTSGYAEGILRTPLRLAGLAGGDSSDAALLAAVAVRLRRQQILKLPDKRFFFVMTESALSNRLANPEDMLAQLRRMREIARQDNVSIRIIPADASLIAAPVHSYELIDDKLVLIDLYHMQVTSQASIDIEAYHDIFVTMTKASVEEIDEILDRYVQIYRDALE
jgi:hypothetical protein